MGAPRIWLFGQFGLDLNGRLFHAVDPHKAEELLCYLLLHRQSLHHRELLADLFLNDCDAAESKKRLRQILWRLQTVLDPGPEQAPLLLVDRDWVRLNPECDYWLDVDVFESACAFVENQPGERLASEQAEVLRRAACLYRGDLLVGWYDDWCLWERERLQNLYLALLDKIMGYCEAHGEYDSGLAYGEEVLRHDRASERTYRRLMRLHARAGARSLAIRQYERCVAVLEQELSVEPAARTVALYEQIRAGRAPNRDAPSGASSQLSSVPFDPALSELLERLQQFEDTLDEMHQTVSVDIHLLRAALGMEA